MAQINSIMARACGICSKIEAMASGGISMAQWHQSNGGATNCYLRRRKAARQQ